MLHAGKSSLSAYLKNSDVVLLHMLFVIFSDSELDGISLSSDVASLIIESCIWNTAKTWLPHSTDYIEACTSPGVSIYSSYKQSQ